jgi:hypothetical protein
MSPIMSGLASAAGKVASLVNKYFMFNAASNTGTLSLYAMQSDTSGNLYGLQNSNHIISVAKDGTFRWSKSFATTTGNNSLIPYRVFVTGNNIYVGGYFNDSGGNTAGFILKLNTSGAIVWQQTFKNGSIDLVSDFGLAKNGDILFVGSYYIYQTGYLDSIYRMNPSTGALISYNTPTANYGGYRIGFPVESSTGKIYSLNLDSTLINYSGSTAIKIDHSTPTFPYQPNSSGMVIDNSDYLYLTIAYTNPTAQGIGVVKINPSTRAVVWYKILTSNNPNYAVRRTPATGGSICIDSTQTYIYVFVGDCIAKLDLNGNIVSGWLRKLTSSLQGTNSNYYGAVNITSDGDLSVSNYFGQMKIKSNDTLSSTQTYTASFQTLTYSTTTQYSSSFVPTISNGSADGGIVTIATPSSYTSNYPLTVTNDSVTFTSTNEYIYA